MRPAFSIYKRLLVRKIVLFLVYLSPSDIHEDKSVMTDLSTALRAFEKDLTKAVTETFSLFSVLV